MAGIEIVYGTAMVSQCEEWQPQALDLLEAHHVNKLDTAQLYSGSEVLLGKLDATSRFAIDTKWRGGFRPDGPDEDVTAAAKQSLDQLRTKQVDVYYIHSPPKEKLETYLAQIQAVYEAGGFKRFGLSNFVAEDVQKIYDHCKSQGYVLPSVYQGNYSPVARKQETVLFPTLRKLGISFYAYSPLAGGFLTKTKQQIQDGAGRFDTSTSVGALYARLYSKPSLLEALAEWQETAQEEGVSAAELAYRWVRFNSPLKKEHGDAIIIGASRLQQLEQTLKGLEAGPLSEKSVRKIDEVWEKIKHEAPLDNYNA